MNLFDIMFSVFKVNKYIRIISISVSLSVIIINFKYIKHSILSVH